VAPGAGSGQLAGKLNLDQVGSIGHSVGGAAAYRMALTDGRIKAAINLDGVAYDVPAFHKVLPPILTLTNSFNDMAGWIAKPNPQAESQAYINGVYQDGGQNPADYRAGLITALAPTQGLYQIDNSQHMDFTDYQTLATYGQSTTVVKIAEAVTANFFNRNLRGRTDISVQSLLGWYPELHQIPVG
jgi:pimeloyl-ACP methyl ester carboxylesterase